MADDVPLASLLAKQSGNVPLGSLLAPPGWQANKEIPFPRLDMRTVALLQQHPERYQSLTEFKPTNRDMLARGLIEGLHHRPDWVEGILGTQGMGQTAPPPTLLHGRWSDLTSFLDRPEDIINPGHIGGPMIGMASPRMMTAAGKALPFAREAEEALHLSPSSVHPDAKRELIDSMYGDAAAERDARQMSAIAADTHRMEQEHGFILVKDPAERQRMGLPPLAASSSGTATAPSRTESWLDSLIRRSQSE